MTTPAAEETQEPVMGGARMKRWGLIVLIGMLVLILGGLVGFQLAVRFLQAKVV